jgi:hypothetical protein
MVALASGYFRVILWSLCVLWSSCVVLYIFRSVLTLLPCNSDITSFAWTSPVTFLSGVVAFASRYFCVILWSLCVLWSSSVVLYIFRSVLTLLPCNSDVTSFAWTSPVTFLSGVVALASWYFGVVFWFLWVLWSASVVVYINTVILLMW